MKEEKWEQLELMSISSAESEDLPSHVCGSESKPSHSVKSKNTHKESSEKTSQEHGYSQTFGHFQQMNFSSLGYLPEDILANLFQMPDSEEARKTTVTSGLRCSELFKRADLIGCLQKMLLVTSQWASTKCFLIWKEKTTPANRLLFQLVPKMPPTDVTESGLWATPRATDGKSAGAGTNDQSILKRMKEGTKNLSEHVQATERKLWFPTPTVNDSKNNGSQSQMNRDTPNLNAVIGGSLNPTWVEWLMGYPIGWTDCADLETP